MLKTLPGITITYNVIYKKFNLFLLVLSLFKIIKQGEEIGMTDVRISWEETVDPQACNTNSTVYHENSRDPARTPFQWDDSVNAGFSNGLKTWLPVGSNYRTVNVKMQKSAERSHLKVFQKLNEIRTLPSVHYGDYEPKIVDDKLFIYRRLHKNK